MDFYATRISLAPPLSSVISAMARAGRTQAGERPVTLSTGAPVRASGRQGARTAPSQLIEIRGRRLAYRRFGEGPTLVLALRFRGVMDSWDPAFLDALAASFTVVIFDYTGLGQSTGAPSYGRERMARDILDLADGLGLGRFVLGGWSLGGVAAQIFAAAHPERVRQLVLIGTTPPGPQPHDAEPIFLQTALKPVNDLEDETILFFEPASPSSRAAAEASHARIAAREGDVSPPVPPETFLRLLQESHDPAAVFPDPDGRHEAFFRGGGVPVLVISGDHEVVFPVQNWHALNRVWPSLHLVTIPQAGHAPQHQMPEFVAGLIAGFVRATPL
ncbi:alpha/beta hydrolase [uncultured Albimonas sp.]|uniref:alpha/beta fold hydrolase n=1 Tax=uncultured Albimonas sp. TaxID=1331701 RepID=UPI0030ED638C